MGERAGAAQEDFASGLGALKQRSNLSYQKLARELGRPVSTIHGWITGRHLPYARDNDDFECLLGLLGSHNTASWMARLIRIRATGDDTGFDNPYRGLESFRETDSDLFHGRGKLTNRLVDMTTHNLVVADRCPLMVVGPSGSGKTSLLRAGLWPSLQANFGCAVHYLTPGNDPIGSLVSAVDSTGTSRLESHHDVVIVDQFEELFAEANSDVVDEFVQLLHHLRYRPRTALVIGLRADFFHRAAAIPFLLRGLQESQIVVGPMTTDEVTDCIVLPARQCGLSVAPDLLAELITEFAGQVDSNGPTDALPLLSHVLYLLTDTSRGRELTLDHYREIGGLTSALRLSAEAVLESLSDEQQTASRFLFTRLVELGIDALPTRRTIDINIVDEAADQLDLTVVIDEFAGHRLLTIDIDTVTISHEALLFAWPRLVEWISEERETLLTVRRVKAATHSWEDAGREPEALLRGSQLDAAVVLLDSSIGVTRLSGNERRFLHDSRNGRTARAVERANRLSRQLSSQALTLQGISPSLSAQIALIANQTASTLESRSVLLGVTSPLPGSRFLGGPGPTLLALSTDGSRAVFSNSVDGSIAVLDSVSGGFRRNRRIEGISPSVVHALALSSDGCLLAIGGTKGAITLVDLATDKSTRCEDGSAPGLDVVVRSLVFDAQGRRLFAAGTSPGIRCWQVARASGSDGPTADLLSVITTDADIWSLALDHDARLLATASRNGTVAVWDLDDPSGPRWSDPESGEGIAAAVAISADGTTLVAGYHSGRVRVWNIADVGNPVEHPIDSPPFASWVNWVDLSADGRVMVAASSDGNVRTWDTSGWLDLRADLRHPTVVTCARCTADRSIITSAVDGIVRVWELPKTTSESRSATIWSLGFDAGGTRLVSSSRTRAVLWTTGLGAPLEVEQMFSPPAEAAGFSGASSISPTGCLVALGTRHGDVMILHPNQSDAEPITLPGLTNLVENLDISADGSMLCGTDRDGNVQVWTIDADQQVVTAGAAKVEAPALFPAFGLDSTTLAVASESGGVTLFDVTLPQCPSVVTSVGTDDSSALSVVFHPTQPVLAVANADLSVSIWDCADRTNPSLLRRLTGPAGNVMIVAFSPNGNRLGAGVTDGKVWLWDTTEVSHPEPIAVIQSKEHGIYALAFSPDGHRLMGAGPRQRIFSWVIDETAAAEAICGAIGDPITPDEWSHLVPSLPYRKLCAG